ncbi:MAG: hypothetical protein WHX52_13845 [Anaerolineae bacterium]
MKIVRLGLWGIILIFFMLLASIPVVWATPEQHPLNQTLPTETPPAISTEVVPPGTPTATSVPLLPPSGNAQGQGFFILTGIFLVGSALVLLLNVRRAEKY